MIPEDARSYDPPREPPAASPGGIPRWGIVALVLLVITCFACIAMGIGCTACTPQVLSAGVDQITTEIRRAAVELGEADTYQADLDRLSQLSGEHRIEFVAMGILSNRWQDAIRDQQVTTEELAHLMELVRDINAGNGHIDMAAYPQGR